VPNLDRAVASWGWLLGELGYELFQDWQDGKSWRSGPTYIVVEQSPARIASRHDRCRPGLNHLAFHVESRARTDELAAKAAQHGWRLMFPDQHPYAGGQSHYAAYLENIDGFEAELVAPLEPPASAAPPAAPLAGEAPPAGDAPLAGEAPPAGDAPLAGAAPPADEAPPAGAAPWTTAAGPADEAPLPGETPPAGSA